VAAEPVQFDAVWKKFRRGETHNSLRDIVPALARRWITRQPAAELEVQEFWALRDVSFSVPAGQGLAIVGPNGAGKSTTLKLLTRILKPTHGHCGLKGRVGALIEVAAGFHPDLTGRENVFLQGAIMGMRRREIQARFDEIVSYSGLEQFIDTPVKRYSSGMNARLGFSIAAHLDPDVLIIDEILSVGDAAFQQRCIERINEYKAKGTAVVFVTHNLSAAATYFDKGLVIDAGRVQFYGSAAAAVAHYTAIRPRPLRDDNVAPAGQVMSAALLNANGEPVSVCVPGEVLTLRVAFRVSGALQESATFGFYVTDAASGLRLFHATARDMGLRWQPPAGGGEVTLDFRFRANLLRGPYHVNCYVSDSLKHEVLDRLEPARHLLVNENFSLQGQVHLDAHCSVHSVQAPAPAPAPAALA
jgi:lipopolysaccharide transport system ATP-binding protein